MLKDGDLAEEEKYALALDFDQVLGLGLLAISPRESVPLPTQIKKLAKERESARAEHNFARSDELRRELESAGYDVMDTKTGQKIDVKKCLSGE